MKTIYISDAKEINVTVLKKAGKEFYSLHLLVPTDDGQIHNIVIDTTDPYVMTDAGFEPEEA